MKGMKITIIQIERKEDTGGEEKKIQKQSSLATFAMKYIKQVSNS
jgi:hypothetical protein